MFIFGAEFNKETVDWILNKTKLAIIENCREDTRRLRGYCCEVKCNGNEESITQCKHASWGVDDCTHNGTAHEWAGVVCMVRIPTYISYFIPLIP